VTITIFGQAKGDNVIYAKNVSFTQVVNALLDSGYVIDKIDKDFFTVTTKYKSFPPVFKTKKSLLGQAFYDIALDIRVKDSVAIIKGRALVSSDSYSNIEYNNKGYYNAKLMGISWNQMDSFVRSLSSSVTYGTIPEVIIQNK
jgi:hypothetical protein